MFIMFFSNLLLTVPKGSENVYQLCLEISL